MAEKQARICIVCYEELKDHCPYNVCKKCCEAMKCDIRYGCKGYPAILENIIYKLVDPQKPKIVEKLDLNGEFS